LSYIDEDGENKRKEIEMKKMLPVITIVVAVLLAGCFEITDVDQPSEANVNTPIQTVFLMKTFEEDPNPHNLIVGLHVPLDWEVDSVYYEGDVFGPDYCTFLHNDSLDANLGGVMDSNWVDSLSFYYPPQEGMEWRIYQGVTAYISPPEYSGGADTAYTDVFIDMVTGSDTGNFNLAYFVTHAALDFTEDGYYDISYPHPITVGGPVGIIEGNVLPSDVTLVQNYPNPFNPVTEIQFTLAHTGRIELAVFDLNGILVKTLHSGILPAGEYSKTWNGTDSRGTLLSSGTYFYKLTSSAGVETRKMMLLK